MRLWPFRQRRVAATVSADDLLLTEELLRRTAEDVFDVREREVRGHGVIFRGRLRVEPRHALDVLLARFQPLGYTPFLRPEGGEIVLQAWPMAETTARPRVGVNVVLFLLTCLTTLVAGSGAFLTFDPFREPARLLGGVSFAGTLGAIIRMRSPAKDRNSLFDIAAAGPLAGLVIAIPAILLGLEWSVVGPVPTGGHIVFGDSLLMQL